MNIPIDFDDFREIDVGLSFEIDINLLEKIINTIDVLETQAEHLRLTYLVEELEQVSSRGSVDGLLSR